MKKRIFAVLLAAVLLAAISVTAFAASNKLAFDSSYDADKNIVSVKLYVEAPGALEAADFNLAFDPDVYEYVDCDESEVSSNAMVVTGESILEEGLATCSVIFTEACAQEDLNENGDLMLVTFQFKPLTEDYDINDFCLWAESYSVNDTNLVSTISPVGNTSLKTGHTAVVTVPSKNGSKATTTAPSATTTTTKAAENNDGNEAANDQVAADNAAANNSSSSVSSKSGTKWYVYVIAGVLAVGAVAGIAMIAIKNNNGEEETADESESDDSDSAED